MNQTLKRQVGLFGAVMLGLGSILGTGVFVSIGIAAGITGPSVILAILIAGCVATCNALSSAQLAASHAVSGGAYEYGYKYLHPTLGFTAGWMFLCAKSASAATAALGFAGYLLQPFDQVESSTHILIAAITCVVMTVIVLGGIRRSNLTNTVIVSLTMISLLALVVMCLPKVMDSETSQFEPFFAGADARSWGKTQALLHATALMFVAYTGYGRIATLGEEVHEPAKTIPRAIIVTLVVSATLYTLVGIACVGTVGVTALDTATRMQAAPLEVVVSTLNMPTLKWLIWLGAMTAMLGVLLNLILGLSRVLLAMGRRGDMPSITTKINTAGTTPYVAVIAVGLFMTGLVMIGNVKTTWSFSAFTVLTYYAINNMAALRLPKEQQLYSRIFPTCGLVSCLFLAYWVDWQIWCVGLALIVVGLGWHGIRQQNACK